MKELQKWLILAPGVIAVASVIYVAGVTVEGAKARITALEDQIGSLEGLEGIPGSKGDPGERGLDGPPGLRGDRGETGAQGEQGTQGQRGETGGQGRPGDPASFPTRWGSCEWVSVGRGSHQAQTWCPDGSFLVGLDLDQDGALSAHDSPVVGQARCCRF